jgi:hypothetical protein
MPWRFGNTRGKLEPFKSSIRDQMERLDGLTYSNDDIDTAVSYFKHSETDTQRMCASLRSMSEHLIECNVAFDNAHDLYKLVVWAAHAQKNKYRGNLTIDDDYLDSILSSLETLVDELNEILDSYS